MNFGLAKICRCCSKLEGWRQEFYIPGIRWIVLSLGVVVTCCPTFPSGTELGGLVLFWNNPGSLLVGCGIRIVSKKNQSTIVSKSSSPPSDSQTMVLWGVQVLRLPVSCGWFSPSLERWWRLLSQTGQYRTGRKCRRTVQSESFEVKQKMRQSQGLIGFKAMPPVIWPAIAMDFSWFLPFWPGRIVSFLSFKEETILPFGREVRPNQRIASDSESGAWRGASWRTEYRKSTWKCGNARPNLLCQCCDLAQICAILGNPKALSCP